ncbi:MAG TPA: hypothetical protein VFT39_13790 [Vicinamibacterales bacterium]|nr:hypothetical protein [Vicinamibacterales bacterium]
MDVDATPATVVSKTVSVFGFWFLVFGFSFSVSVCGFSLRGQAQPKTTTDNRNQELKRKTKNGRARRISNVFNTVVFGGIQTNITNANFGRVSSQANTPRVGQIKVRLMF